MIHLQVATTKPLSKLLTSISTTIKDGLQKYKANETF